MATRKKQVTTRDRVLRSGRSVPAFAAMTDLSISTRCPEKWVAVDLETGDVWIGSETGWTRARHRERHEAHVIVERLVASTKQESLGG